MTILITILLKLIPLYLMILLGFIGARVLKAQKETIARLLIYIISPAVIFYGACTAEISVAHLSLPVLFFCLSCLMAILFFFIGSMVLEKGSTKNILAFAAGTGNTGYFGLPLISAVLGDQAFSLAVLSLLGFVLFENTMGFYLTAKGHNTGRASILKVIKLPTIYAFLIGIILNILDIHPGEIALTTMNHFKGAYTLLGMMIIGMGLAAVKIRNIDYLFISLAFLAKFVFWPVLILGIIAIDKSVLHWYSPAIHNVLIVMAIVPMAANTVAVAAELKVHPDKAALAVLLSTLFALFYIPVMTVLFIGK
jgi:predicted permease